MLRALERLGHQRLKRAVERRQVAKKKTGDGRVLGLGSGPPRVDSRSP